MSHDAPHAQEEFGLMDLLIFLARYKKFIIGFSLAAMMLMLVSLLVRQDEYTATARLLPPQQVRFSSLSLATALGAAANGSVSTGGKTSAELYSSVLKSNSVMDELIARFNLKKVYQTDSQEAAREMLQARTKIVSGKDGFIAVTVKDTDRERVTGLVNAYVNELNRLMHRTAVHAAAQQQATLVRELAAAQKNVAAAERALQQGMEQHGMASAADNLQAIARTIAVLRAQISEQQVNLNAADSFLSSRNPTYLRARQELDSLKLQLDRLSGGGAGGIAKTDQDSSVTAAQLVRNLENARREFESISVQYDLAQMDLSENVIATQVLDDATVPDSPLNPELVQNVLLAGLAAAILAIAACLVVEAMRAMKALKPGSRPANGLFS